MPAKSPGRFKYQENERLIDDIVAMLKAPQPYKDFAARFRTAAMAAQILDRDYLVRDACGPKRYDTSDGAVYESLMELMRAMPTDIEAEAARQAAPRRFRLRGYERRFSSLKSRALETRISLEAADA